MKILLVGPAYPLRGGIANFTERLAEAFQDAGEQVEVLSFSLQYPSFLFPGKTQYTDKATPNLNIRSGLNSINPFNWIVQGIKARKQGYDMIIIMYWLPFMAPCLGTFARIAGKHSSVIAQLHNMIPHEKKLMDKWFSRYFAGAADAFVALSSAVLNDLEMFDREKPRELNPHPVYDNFGSLHEKKTAREKLELDTEKPVILFFGFIRKYKGLDLLLEAAADDEIKAKHIQIVVAGEFYEDPEEYKTIIRKHHLDNVILRNHFIADDEVALYFSAADMVVQPYRSATQSGVTQIAYHFEKPMLVTNVGGLSEIVPHGKAGYAVNPQPDAIAEAINDFYDGQRENYMIGQVRKEKTKYSWEHLVQKIKALKKKLSTD